MTENNDDAKIIQFKKRTIQETVSNEVIATVSIKEGHIGLEVKSGVIYLNKTTVLHLILALLGAYKILFWTTEDTNG